MDIDAYVNNASWHPYRECEGSAKDAWRSQSDEALVVRPDGILAFGGEQELRVDTKTNLVER